LKRLLNFGFGHKFSIFNLIEQGNLGLRDAQDEDLSADLN
jgi:hypothetical protein